MLSLTFGLLLAVQPVQLSEYPQKFRAFYSWNDARVPPDLKRLAKEGGGRALRPAKLDTVSFPVDGVTAFAAGSHGTLWLGTSQGLIRYNAKAAAPDQIQYLAGRRYLPDDEVRSLLSDSHSGVWVGTAGGVSHIELKPMTLEQKAGFFEERILARHDRYGFVATSRLMRSGDLSSNQPESSDNDGLWTAIYGSAECFRYAVTRSPDAFRQAKHSIEALLFLEEVTGRAGFPARSIVKKGDAVPKDGVWRDSADGRYLWKADTSSDEIVGHFLLYSIAYDLLPDLKLKQQISETAQRIMNHILDHGYTLTDVNGKATTWGNWSREYFESQDGKSDGPLNALELLGFLKIAAHVTSDDKYEREYRKVALELGYARHAARYKELAEELNYSDEELAMLSFYPLFRYEHDPRLLAIYRRALDQWWLNMQRERNPLWTFIYTSTSPAAPVDFSTAAGTLYRIPMDLIEWDVANSRRADIRLDREKDRFGRAQTTALLPPDERPVMKWNSNPFVIDGGNNGLSEDDGAFFLLPYWLGRYHGFIIETMRR